MGGDITVESTGVPGEGSTFRLRALVAPAPADAVIPEAPSLPLEGRRILVVDDNADARRVIGEQLRRWGAEVVAVETADAAIEAAAGVRGPVRARDRRRDARGRQRARPRGPACRAGPGGDTTAPRLVIAAAFGRREAVMRAAEARSLSIAGVVSKPAKPSGLADVVGTALGLRSGTLRQQRASTADPGMATRHPLRILLAEDNAVNQMLAGRLLAQLGYRMDVAGDGEEAIQAVERQPYDLVLMDVQMPNLDGLEATRRIVARWPAGERPRIVAMTGNAMSEDRAACFAAGMDGYIAKPIRPAELLAELEATPALPGATATHDTAAGPGAIDA